MSGQQFWCSTEKKGIFPRLRISKCPSHVKDIFFSLGDISSSSSSDTEFAPYFFSSRQLSKCPEAWVLDGVLLCSSGASEQLHYGWIVLRVFFCRVLWTREDLSPKIGSTELKEGAWACLIQNHTVIQICKRNTESLDRHVGTLLNPLMRVSIDRRMQHPDILDEKKSSYTLLQAELQKLPSSFLSRFLHILPNWSFSIVSPFNRNCLSDGVTH